MTFRVTDLMIEAAAKKPSRKAAPCTRCTQCTKTGVSTCTDVTGREGCTDCNGQKKPSKKAKALADLHTQLRETLMVHAY